MLSRSLRKKIQRSVYYNHNYNHMKITQNLFLIQKHASWLILAGHLNKLNACNTTLR